MISRSTVTRGCQLALRGQSCAQTAQRRSFAAAAAIGTPGSFEPTEIAGLKVASKDAGGPTTRLAIVAKAGTRYQPLPGLTVGLEEFAFKNTTKRTALRIVRESELLGGQLTATHTREALVIQANFLRNDLPYFLELLSEVVSQTKYTTFEFNEQVQHAMHLKQAKINAASLALDSAHSVAFHTGLGSALYPSSATPLGPYMSEHTIASYAEAVYNKGNISLVADGAAQSQLSKWGETFFKAIPSASSSDLSLNTAASKYFGGESRTSRPGANAYVIAFPGASLSDNKPEISVLTALLGGEGNVKWTTGFSLLSKAAAGSPGVSASAHNHAYSDAGLLTISISGPSGGVKKTAEEAVKAIKSIADGSLSKEDVSKAIANAKFNLLSVSETSGTGIIATGAQLIAGGKPLDVAAAVKSLESVTADKLKAAAKSLLESKASVASVGDLYVLPYAEDLGLKALRESIDCFSLRCSAQDVLANAVPLLESSYNRYLAVAARAVRRSLKDDKRLIAERRGDTDLRFAKWENGKQGEPKSLVEANTAAMVEAAGPSSS
ncbi:LuxS/MPP-like metallohydrolase [Coniochaeta ligniaria NRRL 30616]|uniref:Cytochrome b-c1 complex subunit 2, mitochondrial n=1 Tax=Coniochaeta ligniaria NRRL 30616 TaxID=1408157 RepID=A0A1J7IL16_9PEZI|nr:LuxS/MPP-like metallohydrolase [Coniochaeta ligniaria NRRL 30616]